MKPYRSLVAALALTSLSVALLAPLALAQTTPAKEATPAPAAKATPAPAAKAAPAPAAKAAAPAPAAKAEAPAKVAAVKATSASSKGTTTGIKTIVGEIVDPGCYIVNGAKGDTHRECTIACAKAGQVLGILEAKTNKLYLIATETPGEDPNKAVLEYAAKKVTVTGKFFTRGGVTAVKIASITPGGGGAK